MVFAPLYTSWVLPGIIECDIVGAPHKEVFENHRDFTDRRIDTELFFNNNTTVAIKEELILKYKINYILVPNKYNITTYNSIKFLENVYNNQQYRFYRVNY